MRPFLYLFPVCLLATTQVLTAQISTFDVDNEGWSANGDPVSNIPDWDGQGGNPGGHIKVTDSSIGGTWYFVAPAKFHGNKCDAYGKYLRYDQITNDTTFQQQYGGKPDIKLVSGSLTLIFDNPVNPGLEWTHYDILLREDAGWRLNSISGPIPTQAQFRGLLADLTDFQIRGEYRSSADIGGLDNVVIESNHSFDLDGDNSSGATQNDFRADTTCAPYSPICDADALLFSETNIDSISLSIVQPNANGLEVLDITQIPSTLSIKKTGKGRYTLINLGMASTADFIAAIRAIQYRDASPYPARRLRTISFKVYVECGEIASAYAYLPIFPPPDAGRDVDTTLCEGSPPFNLLNALQNPSDLSGYWSPSPASGTVWFDPAKDPPGSYRYIIPEIGACLGDTALVQVAVERRFQLPSDTTLCKDEILTLSAPSNLLTWEWSTGSKKREIVITSAGVYQLMGRTATCIFTDSITIGLFTCQTCEFYAPNVFSPNDDGQNDDWHIYAPCSWTRWQLEVYDRWGSLVFAGNTPESAWNGMVRGREALPGVYLWRLEWEGELFGKPKIYQAAGSVTIVR